MDTRRVVYGIVRKRLQLILIFQTMHRGVIRIVDTNNDGSLTPEDRVALGTPYPDFTWGITNTFQIKDFDISFLIQGVQGITVLNGDVYYNETKKWNKKYTKNRWVSAEHPGDGKSPYQNVKSGT